MSHPLIHVQPVAVTDAMLVSSDVPEDDYPVYSAGTTYAQGARVIVTTGVHRVFESAQGGNVGRNPADAANRPTWWLEVGPTNRWRLFDRSNSTQTARSGSMSYRLRPPSPITALAVLNAAGVNEVRVRQVHPTYGEVFDRTVYMASLPSDVGFWHWFFGVRTAPSVFVLTDLSGLPGCDLYVDFTGTTAMAVGVLMFGQQTSLGMGVQQNARLGIQDYSRKEVNDFGDVVLVQRAFAKRASFDLVVPTDQVDPLLDYLASVRATPGLWIGSKRTGGAVVFGWYQEFEVLLAYDTYSTCSLSIGGLT